MLSVRGSVGALVVAAVFAATLVPTPAAASVTPLKAQSQETTKGAGTAASPRGAVPDVSSPVPSADANAQAKARKTAPKVSTPVDASVPKPTDPVSQAVAQAARTGKAVTVSAQTTATSISVAQPDGTVRVETSAGPVRVRQGDGSWKPVDTTLEVTADGVRPRSVPGDTVFSAGGNDLLASLTGQSGSAQARTSITLRWAGIRLPAPTLAGDTATYAEVLPGVDLELTATRLGFAQLLKVKRAPSAATRAALAKITIPVTAEGASVERTAQGQLQVRDVTTKKILGVAAAPVMWDARLDARSGDPAVVRAVGLGLTGAGRVGSQLRSTLSLEPNVGVFADPATVYPVTIDPTQTLGALGDTFVQNNIQYSPQGGLTELRAGTFDGGGQVDRSLLRFDVSALKNRSVQGANLALFESYAYSCSPRYVDIRDAGDFDPNTVTWTNQPPIGGILANANAANGHSSSCPAAWVNFNLTGWAQTYADARNNRPNVMPLAVQVGDERDSYAWKKFNSGNAAGNVPTLTFTYDGGCDTYNGNRVCGAIRDKWAAAGGAGGYLGLPVTSDAPTPDGRGFFNLFQRGSIFWSAATGAHITFGAINAKYAAVGYENGRLGFPTTDEGPTGNGTGRRQEFEGATMLYSAATGANFVAGGIRARYAEMGWEASILGYPTTDEVVVPGGSANTFQNGVIYWSPATGPHFVKGAILATWTALGRQQSFLGFPTSDEYPIASGLRNDFTGGGITWDRASNATLWSAGPSGFAGTPRWGAPLDFPISDTTKASVNLGAGNLTLSVAGLAVPGVGGDRGIGAVYNSLQTATGSVDPTGLLGPGFRLTESPDVRLVKYPDGSVRFIDASGRAAVYAYHPADGSYTSPVGDGGTRLTRAGTAGDWTLTTLASNRRQVFRAADGLLISDADRNGVAYTFSYSGGRPTQITGTRGGTAVVFTLGGIGVPAGLLGRMDQNVDGTNRSVIFGYDASGHLSQVTDTTGGVTVLGWSGNDITRVTDPSGTVTALSYDTSHRATQVVRDLGAGKLNATTTIAYTTNAAGNGETRVTDANNNVTTYAVDALGKVLSATDALGHLQKATYSPNNDVVTAVDAMPAANTTTYSYSDAAGGYTPTGAQLPTGAKATASYPGDGTGPLRYRPTSGSDAQGNATSLAYDAVGNPTRKTQGGVTTTLTYNPPAGQAPVCAGGGRPGQVCTSTDGRGSVTTFSYDGVGNVVRVSPPPGVIKPVSYTYDGVGRTRTVTDGKGQVRTYVYDAADRTAQIRYNGAASCSTPADCEMYSYDTDGNLTQRVDAAGTTNYTYDALNRLISQTTPAASGGGSQNSTLSYDLGGNTLRFTDSEGTTTYAYDASNALVSLAENGGSCAGAGTGCTRFTYDANGARIKTTYPGGTTVQHTNIDASGRPLTFLGKAGNGTTVMNFDYSYKTGSTDSAVVRSRTDQLAPGGASTQGYSYDGRNRLTRALETRGPTVTAAWAYCYDPNGNRTFDTTSPAATIACPGQTGGPAATFTYDATNALTARPGQPGASFAYDNNGNETAGTGSQVRTNATWNPRTQLTTLTSNGAAQTFSYAGEGNKERTTATGAGYQNTPLGVTSQTGNDANIIIREPNGTPVALRVGGVSYYYIADRQGSTISLVDQNGVPKNSYTYDPYGASRAKTETVPNPYQYIGGQYDTTTGLYHLQARYYDPTLGRFTQPDPSGQESNTYLYAGGGPTNTADPTGLWGWGAAIGSIVGAGLGALGCGGLCAVAGATIGAEVGTAFQEGSDLTWGDIGDTALNYGAVGLGLYGASALGSAMSGN